MAESFKTRLLRWRFNFFPAYRRTGARLTYIANDWLEVRIKLPLKRATRNYVGTIFGGSMYAAVDPIYMVMLIRLLGSAYIVWDKAAVIRFKRPGRTTLFATFVLDESEIVEIRESLLQQERLERTYHVDLVDGEGIVYASIEKTLVVRRKQNGMHASS